MRKQQLDGTLPRGGNLGLKLDIQGLDFLVGELFAQESLTEGVKIGVDLKVQGIAQEKSSTRLGSSHRKHVGKEEISVSVFFHIGIIGVKDPSTPRGQLLREEVIQRFLRMEEQGRYI